MTAPLPVSAAAARRLLLARQGLADPRHGRLDGQGLLRLVERLGYVQLDSIATVARAHHLILFARRRGYRPRLLEGLLARDRLLFEHWTHDASIVPMGWFRFWRPRFRRNARRLLEDPRLRARLGDDPEGVVARVRAHVAASGETLARDLTAREPGGRRGPWWGWGRAKTALEYLWHAGELTVTRRRNFEKVYDLTERVVPARHRGGVPDPEEERDWACREALERLGVATPGELARFFDAVSPGQARRWISGQGRRLTEVELADARGGRARRAVASAETAASLADGLATPPPAGLRLLAPFDPILRDRARTRALFGFDYRFEGFVPAPRRLWGYYVLPVLEGDRLIGRADLRTDRDADRLLLRGLWWEPGVRDTAGRRRALAAELQRLARFVGVATVERESAGPTRMRSAADMSP